MHTIVNHDVVNDHVPLTWPNRINRSKLRLMIGEPEVASGLASADDALLGVLADLATKRFFALEAFELLLANIAF